jgi:transaldolase
MSQLGTLYDDFGVSPWIDNLQRSWLQDGTLSKLLDLGVRGLTSNPTILANAISKGEEYDEQIATLKGQGADAVYWALVLRDIGDAADLTKGLFASSGGKDGFISIEVDPRLAHEEDATVEAALALSSTLDRPNVMIKVPATKAGVRAFRRIIAQGVSVNVTLIFSVPRYLEVMEAYLGGLAELAEKDPSKVSTVHSVASFFISRTDTKVDARLDTIGREDLAGRAAIAQAKLAYQEFLHTFSSPQWNALSNHSANMQRPLWASTSTKNPAYPDLLYVEGLIGPNCVNTMPQATLEAYIDHGKPTASLTQGVEDAHQIVSELEAVGIDLLEVAAELEDEGVKSFASAHESILALLNDKLQRL